VFDCQASIALQLQQLIVTTDWCNLEDLQLQSVVTLELGIQVAATSPVAACSFIKPK
jgi:hypothetical protein